MRDQRLGAVHPEGVLHLQMIQIALRAAHAVLFKKFDHQGEHRWLRAAEVVGAVAVRNMTVGFNQPGEVIGHAFQQIFPAALRQPQHGEIRVPVIGFAKAAAGDDIGLRQRQQRRPGDMILRLAGQHRPQLIDVLFQRQVGVGGVNVGLALRQPEVVLNELP